MSDDLGSDYSFPHHITPTDLRPDVILWENSEKSLTLLKLTVCFESAFEEAWIRKEEKYRDLISEAEEVGYKARCITLEMGSRGLPHVNGFKELQVELPVPCKPPVHVHPSSYGSPSISSAHGRLFERIQYM